MCVPAPAPVGLRVAVTLMPGERTMAVVDTPLGSAEAGAESEDSWGHSTKAVSSQLQDECLTIKPGASRESGALS